MKTFKNSIQIDYFYFLSTINSLICRIFFPVDCVNQDQGKRLQGNYSSWVSFLEEQASTFYCKSPLSIPENLSGIQLGSEY